MKKVVVKINCKEITCGKCSYHKMDWCSLYGKVSRGYSVFAKRCKACLDSEIKEENTKRAEKTKR